MATSNIAAIPAKLYELLKDLSPEDRARVISATLVLFGDQLPEQLGVGVNPANTGDQQGKTSGGGTVSAQQFMDEKDPQNKSEALAVAARYREIHMGEETHTKDELRQVFSDARRNFDVSNFARDIKNARRQSGYFNLNTKKGADTLSYYGQNYVDKLPNREEAKQIKRPAVRKKPSSKAKKVPAKKAAQAKKQ